MAERVDGKATPAIGWPSRRTVAIVRAGDAHTMPPDDDPPSAQSTQMRYHLSRFALAIAAIALPTLAAAQSAAPADGPAIGQVAPDFTAAWADGSGPRSAPVSLASLRGKVVVLAFYPKDRTGGCTAELTKFRDEYATLFGKDVVVLPVSADSIPSHVSWASEMKFPFALVSDPSLSMADAYGSRTPGRSNANRTVFVIGKDGKVVYRELKFNALAEEGYTALAAAVAKARG
jgi:peroxiredoxin Q/BCP